MRSSAIFACPAWTVTHSTNNFGSIVYLNHSVRFDTRRADDLLARHGLRCPRFEEYVTPVVRFFREHEDDPAFAATG